MEDITQINLSLKETGYSCTIDPTMITDRKSLLQTLSSKITGRHDTDTGYVLLINYSKEVAHLLLDFILAEQQCCAFFDFSLQFNIEEQQINFGITSKSVEKSTLHELMVQMFPE